MLVTVAVMRWRHRSHMQIRLATFGVDAPIGGTPRERPTARELAERCGALLVARWSISTSGMSRRIERAGLSGRVSPYEVLGWRVVSVALGLGLGLVALARYGMPGVV